MYTMFYDYDDLIGERDWEEKGERDKGNKELID